jgi:hypothetical protein
MVALLGSVVDKLYCYCKLLDIDRNGLIVGCIEISLIVGWIGIGLIVRWIGIGLIVCWKYSRQKATAAQLFPSVIFFISRIKILIWYHLKEMKKMDI